MTASDYPRISPFWLDPTRTITREYPETPPEAIRYVYAVEHQPDGSVTMHRFAEWSARPLWIARGGGTRESIKAKDPLVVAAKAADEWPDDEDEV